MKRRGRRWLIILGGVAALTACVRAGPSAAPGPPPSPLSDAQLHQALGGQGTLAGVSVFTARVTRTHDGSWLSATIANSTQSPQQMSAVRVVTTGGAPVEVHSRVTVPAGDVATLTGPRALRLPPLSPSSGDAQVRLLFTPAGALTLTVPVDVPTR